MPSNIDVSVLTERLINLLEPWSRLLEFGAQWEDTNDLKGWSLCRSRCRQSSEEASLELGGSRECVEWESDRFLMPVKRVLH